MMVSYVAQILFGMRLVQWIASERAGSIEHYRRREA